MVVVARRRLRAPLALLLLAAVIGLLGREPAHAGLAVWTSNGPEGGAVRALAVNPSSPQTLYAGTGGGVFKSSDGGGSWRAVNTGLGNTTVSALAIDPVNPAILYAGTAGGVFKSVDAGAGWTDARAGLGPVTVAALAVDPSNPAVLYAGTSTGGVFKSIDGALNWVTASLGLPANAQDARAGGGSDEPADRLRSHLRGRRVQER